MREKRVGEQHDLFVGLVRIRGMDGVELRRRARASGVSGPRRRRCAGRARPSLYRAAGRAPRSPSRERSSSADRARADAGSTSYPSASCPPPRWGRRSARRGISGVRPNHSRARRRCTRLRRIDVRSTASPRHSGERPRASAAARAAARGSPRRRSPRALFWRAPRRAAWLRRSGRAASSSGALFASFAAMPDAARLIENLLYTYAERIDAGNSRPSPTSSPTAASARRASSRRR